jgi:hypothetical protein
MKNIQAISADSAPAPLVVHRLSVISQCTTCKVVLPVDALGTYKGAFFCDDCAESLSPERYNADLCEILLTADRACVEARGMSVREVIERGSVALVEDDLGDLVYRSQNSQQLFIEAPVLGGSTTDYLPEDVRLSHRKLHRESVKTQTVRGCLQTISSQHWMCKIFPFIAAAEIFTLTLFQVAV